MFGKWLSGETNPTYEKLVKVLAAVGKRNVAEAMCRIQGEDICVCMF